MKSAAKPARKKRKSGPSGENKQPRVTFRSARLDEYREAAAAAGEDLTSWLDRAAQARLAAAK